MNIKLIIVKILFALLILLLGFNCFDDIAHKNDLEASAKRYCTTCHVFPEPSLLDKKTWAKDVLPAMGWRLGIRKKGFDPFQGKSTSEIEYLKKINIYPDQAIIPSDEWKQIVEYYSKMAPDSLERVNLTKTSQINAPFNVEFVNIGDKKVPQVSLLEFDEGKLYIGDANNLYALSYSGELINSWATSSPSVDLLQTKEARYLVGIGSFALSDESTGYLIPIESNEDNSKSEFVLANLPRPVHANVADLNNDGREDLIVCGFGNQKGRLAWYDHFEIEHVLSTLSGSRRTVVEDFDGDGDLDIMALMAQSWERVVMFYNNGFGEFEQKTLLSFSPVHGLSDFELLDFNGDGFKDLLIANGDNWDYSPIKKPYHGVRIYLNNGANEFDESFFYPLNGCSKAMAIDFDDDGDLDIAAIAFYDHLEDPGQSFVYLENQGNLSFNAH